MKPNIFEGYTLPIHLANFEMGRSGLEKLRGDRLVERAIAIGERKGTIAV